MVITNYIEVKTLGEGQPLDITAQVTKEVEAGGLASGIATLFVAGSTPICRGTIESATGLLDDLTELWERLVPRSGAYRHNRIDDNGHAHLRAHLLGPSLTIPLVDGHLPLGTWQQIVLVDFDTRPRQRRVIVQLVGE